MKDLKTQCSSISKNISCGGVLRQLKSMKQNLSTFSRCSKIVDYNCYLHIVHSTIYSLTCANGHE